MPAVTFAGYFAQVDQDVVGVLHRGAQGEAVFTVRDVRGLGFGRDDRSLPWNQRDELVEIVQLLAMVSVQSKVTWVNPPRKLRCGSWPRS